MKILIASLLVLFAIHSRASELADDPARPTLGKTGQLFVLKLIPGQKRLEVRLAGTPAAQVDPGRLEIFGRVYEKDGQGKPTQLRVQAAKDHFELKDAIEPGSAVEFEIKDKMTKKSETLRLEQKSKP